MSVLIVTSLGDLVVDLYTDRCPLTAKNFLKLCKIKYYNGCLFHTVQKDFTAQTGDPTGNGTGGDSIYKFLYGDQARFFGDEIHLDLKHSKTGTVAMASAGENLNASQFYFTLRDDLDYLDEKHTVFGEVAEGLETLSRMNEAYVDEKGRPYKNIRIKHTYILDDPFDDPSQLVELIPEASPEGKPKDEIDNDVRLEDDWVPMDEKLSQAELEEIIRAKEAHSSAIVLESIGDIPEAEIKPPENVLFVCKLNPVTEDEDLHTIFSRFGNVISADVIRDYKTGDSLCYAFIEFETKEACEQAYYKMDNALIDDRRIHVDFSQSVSKLWSQFRRKDNQMGKGCFKCGAVDHIARDCTMDGGTRQQPSKYMLKDENIQRGGNDNSRYEMVFDGDMPASSEQDKRHRDREPEDHSKKQKIDKRISEDLKHKEHESYRPGHEDRSRRHREDQSNEEYNASRYGASKRDEEVSEGRGKREHTYRDRDIYRRHDSRADRRDGRERSRDEEHGDGRPDKEKAHQKRDDYKRHDSSVDKRGERDYKRRDSDRYQDKKDERDYRRSADKYSHGDRKEEPDCGKREDNDSKRDYVKRREYTDHADKRERRKKDCDHYLDQRYKEERRL